MQAIKIANEILITMVICNLFFLFFSDDKMRAKPPTRTRALRSNRLNSKAPEKEKKEKVQNLEPEKPDISVLRRPIDTSVNGLDHVVKLFESGTKEVISIAFSS